MAETEVKKINGRELCDNKAREDISKLSEEKADKNVIINITKTTSDDGTAAYSADKTFEEIETAISEDKEVKVKFNATYYSMVQHNVGKNVWFQCCNQSSAGIINYMIKADNTVTLAYEPVQATKDRVDKLDADSTTTQYPSAKAVVDYVDGYSAINKNLLIVNVDTETKTADKTAKEIYESAQSGIPCVCMYYDIPFVYSQGVNVHWEDYGYALFNYPRDDNNQLKIDCQGKVTVRNTELYSKEATEDQRGLVRLGRGFKKPDYPDVDKYLVDNVICPESAEVGQIVRITAVDENGVPTAVEAIDAPEQEDPEQIAELVFLNYIDAIDDINGETVYGTEQLQEDLDEINGEEV